MKRHWSSWVSMQFGRFASHAFAPWLQRFINRSYVSLLKLDMSEFEAPETYPTLNALFTRKLRTPRSVSPEVADLIAPCDALITECGMLDEERALQIKGMEYRVPALLGDAIDPVEKARIVRGSFANFYLSPRDYHRYHVPIDCRVLQAVHIPGKLYPVNMPSLKRQVDLFIENERVIVECETMDAKRFYMVLVGALNVGKMHLSFEPRIATNGALRTPERYTYEGVTLSKGDELGYFEMGSTIVIIAEPGMVEWQVEAGYQVKYAQTIGRVL